MNQDIRMELRKIRRLLLFVLLLFVCCFLPIFYNAISRVSARSWEDVRVAMAREDFRSALSTAKALVARAPDYEYGRRTLGDIYLAMDDVSNAVAQYTRARTSCARVKAIESCCQRRESAWRHRRLLSC
jgi:hypothetical protein